MPERAKIQRLPPPPYPAEPGLVQGLSWFDRDRSRKKHPDPPGPGVRPGRRTGPRMGRAFMISREVDFSDVQGIVRFGYGKLRGASYALLRVKNGDAARAWMRTAKVS